MTTTSLTRRSFLIGTGAAIATLAASGVACPVAASSATSIAAPPAPDFTVMIVDRQGDLHLVGAYGGTVHDAVVDGLQMLAEDMLDNDDAGNDDLTDDELEAIEADSRIQQEMWIDDCRLVRAWPGYHSSIPDIAPVYDENHLEERPKIGAVVDVGMGKTGTVVRPYADYDDPVTVSVQVPAGSSVVRDGATTIRPTSWGRMVIRHAGSDKVERGSKRPRAA